MVRVIYKNSFSAFDFILFLFLCCFNFIFFNQSKQSKMAKKRNKQQDDDDSGDDVFERDEIDRDGKRKRSSNWTQCDTELLASLLLQFGEFGILCKASNATTNAKKTEEWKLIETTFNSDPTVSARISIYIKFGFMYACLIHFALFQIAIKRDRKCLLARFKKIMAALRLYTKYDNDNARATGGGPRPCMPKFGMEITGPLLVLKQKFGIALTGLAPLDSDSTRTSATSAVFSTDASSEQNTVDTSILEPLPPGKFGELIENLMAQSKQASVSGMPIILECTSALTPVVATIVSSALPTAVCSGTSSITKTDVLAPPIVTSPETQFYRSASAMETATTSQAPRQYFPTNAQRRRPRNIKRDSSPAAVGILEARIEFINAERRHAVELQTARMQSIRAEHQARMDQFLYERANADALHQRQLNFWA